jgi:hypothetical protein
LKANQHESTLLRAAVCGRLLEHYSALPDGSLRGGKVAEVRAYVFTLKGKPARSILQDGVLRPGMLEWEGVRLTPAQTEVLLDAVTGRKPGRAVAKACYEPHHAFVFYDSARKPAGIIEVCFKCSRHRAGPDPLPGQPDLELLEKLVRAVRLPVQGSEQDYADFIEKQRTKQK